VDTPHATDVAFDGHSALEMFADEPFPIILIDMVRCLLIGMLRDAI